MDPTMYNQENIYRRAGYIHEGQEPDENEHVRIVYIDAHPPGKTQPKGVVLLIHGFPQTSHQFRKVITPLTKAGYRLIIPDYRGAGESSRPIAMTGYRKTVMAQDLHHLITKELEIKTPIHVVGHDIGGMIAHAYANLFASDTASLIWGECPLPGTSTYEEVKSNVAVWHFTFHRVTDLPELLIAGRERAYIKHFFDKQAHNQAAIISTDVDVYEKAYSLPGAMRAALNVYRMFDIDAKENTEHRDQNGKSKVRCLVLNGEKFLVAARAQDMAEEFYEDFEVDTVPESGHYIAEEQPEAFTSRVLAFIGRE